MFAALGINRSVAGAISNVAVERQADGHHHHHHHHHVDHHPVDDSRVG